MITHNDGYFLDPGCEKGGYHYSIGDAHVHYWGTMQMPNHSTI